MCVIWDNVLMNTTITSLRSQGHWYIVPAGDWLDSLKSNAHGVCVCGHDIEHSYFAVLVDAGGENVRCVECGSTCIIELTGGHIYKTPSEFVYLNDDQMTVLFWAGHMLGKVGDNPQYKCMRSNPSLRELLDQVVITESNKFYVSVYEFALAQYAKTGFCRITEKQFNSISKLFK